MGVNVSKWVLAFNVDIFKGNFNLYDKLKQKYLKTIEKVVYISGYDPQITHIVLFFLTFHHQKEYKEI